MQQSWITCRILSVGWRNRSVGEWRVEDKRGGGVDQSSGYCEG